MRGEASSDDSEKETGFIYYNCSMHGYPEAVFLNL